MVEPVGKGNEEARRPIMERALEDRPLPLAVYNAPEALLGGRHAAMIQVHS